MNSSSATSIACSNHCDETLELFTAFAQFIGAHSATSIKEHEIDRASQRTIGCLAVLLVLIVSHIARQSTSTSARILIGLVPIYLAIPLSYTFLAGAPPNPSPLSIHLDPFLLTLTLYLAPVEFAFLNPFLLVVIVRTGIRYGIRTMYLSWVTTLLSSIMLLTSEFWRANVELTLTFCLMLALVPTFFSSLIRRIHVARSIEEERARLLAKNESVIARSAFLAKVSHELRSPLQGIVSALDVLSMRHGPGKDPDDELIGRIRRSSLLLNTHLRDMLTLAKGEAGRLEMRPEPFDAAALVESVAASAVELAKDKKLELLIDVPEDTTFVVADGARIDQILTNLVINSIRYTDRGQVRLGLERYDASDRLLRFNVADTGSGIPAAMLPTLLIPDRIITGSERRGEGSGIGLAIVRTLVDHLGGHIKVKSQLGKGTTFTVTIPAEPVEADEHEASRESPDRPNSRRRRSARRTRRPAQAYSTNLDLSATARLRPPSRRIFSRPAPMTRHCLTSRCP